MIIELKRGKARKAAVYKSLPTKGLGEGVEMWALTTNATLGVKTLDENTDSEEFVTVLATVRDADGHHRR